MFLFLLLTLYIHANAQSISIVEYSLYFQIHELMTQIMRLHTDNTKYVITIYCHLNFNI